MRVTLIIHSMAAGGAERAMSNMANHWASHGHDVTLLTFTDAKATSFYPLHGAIVQQPLAIASDSPRAWKALRANVRRLRMLRQAIKGTRPDIVISLMTETNVLTLLATRGLRVPVVVQEQVDPAQHQPGRKWELLRRWTYPAASCVVVLAERSLDYFSKAVRSRARVIPNPISVEPPEGDVAPTTTGRRRLVAMGRLDPQKGFDLLIQAFGSIAARHPVWDVDIWGEGLERAELEAAVLKRGLSDRIRLRGLTAKPHAELRQADLFVLSSRYEGFPLVLCEAMACGLPAISFNCPTGPQEIIRENVDGLLVPPEDPTALAAAMNRLMGDDSERRRLAANAPQVLERFGVPVVMRHWEDLVHALLARNSMGYAQS